MAHSTCLPYFQHSAINQGTYQGCIMFGAYTTLSTQCVPHDMQYPPAGEIATDIAIGAFATINSSTAAISRTATASTITAFSGIVSVTGSSCYLRGGAESLRGMCSHYFEQPRCWPRHSGLRSCSGRRTHLLMPSQVSHAIRSLGSILPRSHIGQQKIDSRIADLVGFFVDQCRARSMEILRTDTRLWFLAG